MANNENKKGLLTNNSKPKHDTTKTTTTKPNKSHLTPVTYKPKPKCKIKHILQLAYEIFKFKQTQYGNSIQHLSIPTLLEIIQHKLSRINNLIQTKSKSGHTNEHITNDTLAIINYTITIHLITQNKLTPHSTKTLLKYYKTIQNQTYQLFLNKSKDYNNQHQKLTTKTITEIITTKLHRIQHILNNIKTKPNTKIQNEIPDIINYTIFLHNNITSQQIP